ncbi:MAG: hypothetical protein CL512_05575 [Actinobacteria bacterium]|nr:hypothetical protein [Actinomycetota bacterium]|tara:strand:- start:776 stop:1057 length:282 start_codon:yes stop_codon:yes gene_type:complete
MESLPELKQRNNKMDYGIKLQSAIKDSSDSQVDAVWAILKYKEIGIYRKVASMCEVLDIDFDEVIDNLPQDEEGRILDYKTRHLVHDILIEVS